MIASANEQERRILLEEWNFLIPASGEGLLAHELLELRANERPDAPAVICGDQLVSYGELNARANRLAHFLKSQGVGPDVLVGIFLERSARLVEAVFATLKAGGACLPLDPGTPPERLAFILKEGNARVILTEASRVDLISRNPVIPVIQLDADDERIATCPSHPPNAGVGRNNLSRVFFTSGSMGVPKAVMWAHSVQKPGESWSERNFRLNSEDRFLMKSSLAFTPINLEIFQPICVGATVIVAPPNTEYDMELLAQFMARQRITILNIVPTLLRLLLETGRLKECESLRNVVCFGEALAPAIEAEFFRQSSASLTVIYGATEAPSSTFRRCNPAMPTTGINIGRRLGNKQVLILNEKLDLAPIGATGEICIGGDHLALGYLNDPELTALKFIPNPFSTQPGARLYRTGDLARQLPDGSLEFIGRIDRQVKIRGVRVELEEVETVMRRHPLVGDAAAVARNDSSGNPSLIAYLTIPDHAGKGASAAPKTDSPVPMSGASSKLDQVREFLRERLPGAMMPSRLVLLESFPMTGIGKIDRKALPDPLDILPGDAMISPRSPEEARIVRIWMDLLGLKEIGVNDSFFNIGGHSLLGARLASMLSEEFDAEFSPRHLLESPTIAQQALHFERLQSEGNASAAPPRSSLMEIQKGAPCRPALFFIPGGKGGEVELLAYARFLHRIGEQWPVCGFCARGFDGVQAPHSSVALMAADYLRELRERQPHGPYFLAGECLGGNVAYEMARQLSSAREQVAFLGLLDSTVPNWPRFLSTVSQEMRRRLLESRKMLENAPKGRWLQAIRLQAHRLLRLFGDQLGLMTANPFPADPQKRESHRKRALSCYAPTLLRYRPKSYSGTVHFFLSEEGARLDILRPWRRAIRGQLNVHELPGDHSSYLIHHHREVGEKFRSALEIAESSQ